MLIFSSIFSEEAPYVWAKHSPCLSTLAVRTIESGKRPITAEIFLFVYRNIAELIFCARAGQWLLLPPCCRLSCRQCLQILDQLCDLSRFVYGNHWNLLI